MLAFNRGPAGRAALGSSESAGNRAHTLPASARARIVQRGKARGRCNLSPRGLGRALAGIRRSARGRVEIGGLPGQGVTPFVEREAGETFEARVAVLEAA